MLRGWLQSKKGELNASTHSLDSLAEPQNCWSYALIYLANPLTDKCSGNGDAGYAEQSKDTYSDPY